MGALSTDKTPTDVQSAGVFCWNSLDPEFDSVPPVLASDKTNS